MIEKKVDKTKHEQKPRDDVELENQFILRLPEDPSKVLREALQTGNLKDRMTIKMDTDLRYGEVRLDNWNLYAKIVDIPTIIECMKTIDNKNFYKSADICQLMICKEEPEEEPEKESPTKGKKKDPNKVDKKYLWPHGITPPCKNVRKRRFRKTLKKKNVEAPEIEKEVKRLLRIDNDAVKVDYEIIDEELDKPILDQSDMKDYNDGDDEYNDETINEVNKTLNDASSQRDINVESDDDDTPPFSNNDAPIISGVGEHDIFGEEVSSSDDDRDMEDTSRLSADDSRMSDFYGQSGSNKTEPNEFSKSMFSDTLSQKMEDQKLSGSSSNLAAPSGYYDQQLHQQQQKRSAFDDDFSNDGAPQMTIEQINAKILELRRQCDDLKLQQSQKEEEIASIQNPTLKLRMQETLDNMLSQLVEKELEIKDYENML